jgi:spore coat protein CotF
MNYGIKRSLQSERSSDKGRGQLLIEAHQMMHVGEAMRNMVNCMNTFRMYRPQVRESQMTSMIDRQLEHMMGMCSNILNYAQTTEINNIMPDRIVNWQANVNQMQQPINMNSSRLDDRDMASCMASALKSCVVSLSVATLACSDDTIRKMVMNCCTSCMNMSYDMLMYIQQKALSQTPNLQTNAMYSAMNVYQPLSEMQYQ